MKNYIMLALFTAVLSTSATSAEAASCTATPSCDTLGYTKSASQCNGMPSIKCPWNTSKMFCDENPCDNVNPVVIPANGVCATWSSACPTKCIAWGCKIGYVKSGNSCVIQQFDPLPFPDGGCKNGMKSLICNGREYCCPANTYTNCAEMNAGVMKCIVANTER